MHDQVEAFLRVIALPSTDTCSHVSIFNLYQSLKNAYKAKISENIRKAQSSFMEEFGFEAAEYFIDLKKQMEEVSAFLDKELDKKNYLIAALEYFVNDNPDTVGCTGISNLSPRCEYYWNRISDYFKNDAPISELEGALKGVYYEREKIMEEKRRHKQ